jgi:DHA2 family multidrug resistance protein
LLAALLVEDPEYLRRERAERLSRPIRFDTIGLGLLILVMASWEVLLSKGQEWDWFGDPFGRIQTLAMAFTAGLALLVIWEMKNASPIVDFRVLGNRNLTISCVILFCAFGVLYGTSVTLPAMLQTLFGYDALQAGLVLSPGGATSITALIVVGFMLGRGIDARWLIALGLLVMGTANYWMSQMNLEISPRQVVGPRMMLTGGIGLIFAPLSVAAYKYVPLHLRGAAVGLASLLRNEGASVGISLAQTTQQRRDQFHLSRLGEFLHPLNPHVSDYLQQSRDAFFLQAGHTAAANQMALQTLDNLRQQQALSLAYFDVFLLAMIISLPLLVLVPFMKRSVTEKVAHVAAD